ncbi:putative wall-associated receptor kinase, galacturonan-binding domain-containing protein [Helianthus annuus]|uniref:Wall-associated receptor kinase, galacturonan-binding domain-containing protein n=1 Tax=Helianthus annuus TaxID=4232 RepID=A0A9K3HL76_HELAN|nr:putative wall-associated receptor kinase, galacturonan-binding domain-containing protein [Helianthus annuus]KAJ0500143.1 putative wall-associated receptor kinase, galacturonan-binding domain-containing protein [Helianthus annuus]KAJ0500145.1 putative wall-associated receptor kinase, galacturonan-binding domain-containing protein [Helianthus annuus]KAJ0515985.1 putative wall-associated receptor kinase, galacturonan-binding domain-containing protein [Helianthus annuus]KAJ0515987.1 putative wal
MLNSSILFWGLGLPAYCGHPGFQLTCESDVPVLVSKSTDYRVLNIDSSAHTITIARKDLWSNICPEYLHNTTYDSTLFNGSNLARRMYLCTMDAKTVYQGMLVIDLVVT